MVLQPGLLVGCNQMKRLEYFSKRLGGALELWNPTSGACFAFWSDSCPAETTLKLEDSFWQD